ncbi:ergothioneine biosynthesis glutamate--cysteine ligase EgtA [uncultured Nocardioides sp.]|uniref:ergothioneine biosynthesis glutamate--cysteine ligase EgtA n=1 Tax=uncultured Nocardioides sp. TaxID=198441 RepID=UPI0026157AB5|nr:ergothioneine biosynthesis glutamate--cysteine ligase EgtA [uncultured Nocardioides sp.]
MARAHVMATALAPDDGGRVGLELEMHLVDLAAPHRRPAWEEVQALVATLPAMPRGSSVTLEPGGQVELSSPPGADVASAVADLGAEVGALRGALAEAGYGAAALGTDPARPVARVNPSGRYDAMEAHFDALGCAGAGRSMMAATAALQVNLDAGPPSGWDDRLALARSLVPVLVALSSTSPYLAGRTSGWHSMRQGTWQGIDQGRCAPVSAGEPRAAWAFYAIGAPVMLVRDAAAVTAGVRPVTDRVPFAAWLRGLVTQGPFVRPPTRADLDYHLTTLFPPVRPRGYVEMRCLDAAPDAWWPALAALAATLMDHPGAAARAAEACEPVADAWVGAARDGLADPEVGRAARVCTALGATHGPAALADELAALAELTADGRTIADDVRRRAEGPAGPLRLLEEEARG